MAVTVKTPAPERAAGRRKLAAKGQALPGGQEPIPDVPYLKKAIRSVGRLDPAKRPALKKLIIKRAKALGALNEPGVRGTWAFQGAGDSDAVDLAMAMPKRTPVVRGAEDVQMSRTAPGVITVTHKPTGMKVGTITPKGVGYGAAHSDGTATPASGSQQGALAGLIRYHNQMAAQKNAKAAAMAPGAGIASVKGYAGEQQALDLAMTVPANTSSDGPRMTVMAGGKPSPVMAKLNLSPEGAKVYAKLRKKGLDPKAALAMAKRAAAMHSKAAAKAA